MCMNLQNSSSVGHSAEATDGVELWPTQSEVGHFPNRSLNNLINNNNNYMSYHTILLFI